MPEGHTLHRLARDLTADLVGHEVTMTSPQGRFAAGAADLDGRRLDRAEARGKHLFLWFGDDALHIHLGLIGKFRRQDPSSEPGPNIRLRVETANSAWDLSGPMVCRRVDQRQADDIVAGLGPDPLRRDGTTRRFAAALSSTSRPIGAALLDQTLVAGVGNVYRSELLFLEGLHPLIPADRLEASEVADLWASTRRQLSRGVKLDRIVTRDRDELTTSLAAAPDHERLYVYKRSGEPCHRCSAPIRTHTVANRTMWHCPTCQPESPR